jgi:hypothetical protein
MTITREALLGKTSRRYKDVVIHGESYRIQSLTELERTQYEIALQGKKGFAFEKARRLFVCKCLVDADGKRLLLDSDEEQLKNVDGGLIGLLYSEAQEHCGYAKDEIEELVKNSEEVVG